MMRTHRAGDIGERDTGQSVVVCGWVANRRDHGGKVFLDVRDVAGVVQVVVDPNAPGLDVAHRVRNEWVVRVVGVDEQGSQLTLRGVVEDRSQLQPGESPEVGLVVDRERRVVEASFVGRAVTLALA